MKRMVLYCRVGKVENLPPSSSISQLADPYVLLQTHPQASEFSRSARTTTKFQALSATFMEPFLFENLRPEVQDLTVSVWDENTGSEHSCLGYVVIPFELVWHNMLKSPAAKKDSDVLDKIEACTMGFELQNAKGKTVLGRNGPSAVHISAWFGTFQETFAACKYSHRGVPGNVGEAVFFEPELRTLHIDILKAKNVPPKVSFTSRLILQNYRDYQQDYQRVKLADTYTHTHTVFLPDSTTTTTKDSEEWLCGWT